MVVRIGTAFRSCGEDTAQQLDRTVQIGRQQLVRYPTVERQASPRMGAHDRIAQIRIAVGLRRKEPADGHAESAADRMQRLDRRAGDSAFDLAEVALGQTGCLAQLAERGVACLAQPADFPPDARVQIQYIPEVDGFLCIVGTPFDIRRAENLGKV